MKGSIPRSRPPALMSGVVRAALLFRLLASHISSDLVAAVVVGAAVLPHGDFALDPSLIDNKNGSLAVHLACEAAASWIGSLRPDRVVLSTPHGLELSEDWALYLNSEAQGAAKIGDDLHNASFKPYEVGAWAALDKELTTAILEDARDSGLGTITALQAFADADRMPIGWAEVVPLVLMKEFVNQTKLVILSHPLRRYNHSADMIPELLDLGASMYKTLDKIPERVVVVISADLAHTHSPDGPYGFSPSAAPFDQACGRWASTLESVPLLHEAAALANEAKACGYTGLVLLHGMLMQQQMQGGDGAAWGSTLLANQHPTYYGMLVAIFQPTRAGGGAAALQQQ